MSRRSPGFRSLDRAASTSTPVRRVTADTIAGRTMDLIERAQVGDAEAFIELFRHYSDTVYSYIYYRVGGRATAEDLTSETFLRALRRIGTFTWQSRDFGAWLVTIARNLVADHFKSGRFHLEVTAGEILDANEVERSAEDSALEPLSNAALLDALRRLNPQQQECLTLRFLQGLSVAETARVMGKNEAAIKTLQYRAVRTVARLMPAEEAPMPSTSVPLAAASGGSWPQGSRDVTHVGSLMLRTPTRRRADEFEEQLTDLASAPRPDQDPGRAFLLYLAALMQDVGRLVPRPGPVWRAVFEEQLRMAFSVGLEADADPATGDLQRHWR
ncbi:RNA polymerase sigma-70 factor, TIGR02952 family [Streptomyces sp. 2231.1]|nr:RNA polymerase sigma-70 factor, TIGR02952 family [Streptomyces sp. 2231.1]